MSDRVLHGPSGAEQISPGKKIAFFSVSVDQIGRKRNHVVDIRVIRQLPLHFRPSLCLSRDIAGYRSLKKTVILTPRYV